MQDERFETERPEAESFATESQRPGRQWSEPEPTRAVNKWIILVHLAAFAGLLFPYAFGHIIGPLAVWLLKRGEVPELDAHGKEAVNFQISISIYLAVAGLLAIVFIGIPFIIGLVVFDIIMVVNASIRASEGKRFRYPLSLQIIR